MTNKALMVLCLSILSFLIPYSFPRQVFAETISSMLAHADVVAGEKVSHRCKICHTFNKDGPNKVGPNLWNIVGSNRAHNPSYNYSDALKKMHDQKWTYEALDLWLTNPHKFIPGDKMPFPGLKDQKQRANLIAWLRTLSDHPQPLPQGK